MTTYVFDATGGDFSNANNWLNSSTGKHGDGVPGSGDTASGLRGDVTTGGASVANCFGQGPSDTTLSGGLTASDTLSGATLSGGSFSGDTVQNIVLAGGDLSATTLSGAEVQSGTVSTSTIQSTTIEGGQVTADSTDHRGGVKLMAGSLGVGSASLDDGFVGVFGGTMTADIASLSDLGFIEVSNGGSVSINGATTIGNGVSSTKAGFIVGRDDITGQKLNGPATLDLGGNVTIESGMGIITYAGITTVTGEAIVDNNNTSVNVGIVSDGGTTKLTGATVIGKQTRGALNVVDGGTAEVTTLTVGQNANAEGQVHVAGVGSEIEVGNNAKFGMSGTGRLQLSQGAGGAFDDLQLGTEKTGKGFVFATDAGTELTISGDATVGVAGHGIFDLDNGATAEIDGELDVGSAEGGAGVVTLTGPGTKLSVASGATFGSVGAGSSDVPENGGYLTLAGGAVFDAGDQDVTFGDEAGSTATLLITGENSMLLAASLTFGEAGKAAERANPGGGDPLIAGPTVTAKGAIRLTGDMTLGADKSGNGALDLSAGATAAVGGDLTVGEKGKGALTVDQASMTVNGDFAIGAAGSGTVTVQLGGRIGGKTAKTEPDAINLGEDVGGKGKLTIVDKGSSVISQEITVGALGTGSVTVSNAASLVTKGEATLADAVLVKTQSVTLKALGVWSIGGDLTAGSAGFASISVQTGATLDAAGDVVLGEQGGASGSVSVGGSGKSGGKIVASSLDWGGEMVVGEAGKGTLAVSAGATVDPLDGGKGVLTIAAQGGSNGTVSVSGAGSKLSGNSIAIGGTEEKQGGNGSLQVSDSAKVSFEDAVIWKSGTVTVAGGELDLLGDIKGNGAINIGKGGMLRLEGSDASIGISFAAHAGGQVLSLGSAAALKAAIKGFDAGDQILVDGLGKHVAIAVAASKTAATVTFKEGGHVEGSLKFTGDYLTDDFHFKNGALTLTAPAHADAADSESLHHHADDGYVLTGQSDAGEHAAPIGDATVLDPSAHLVTRAEDHWIQ